MQIVRWFHNNSYNIRKACGELHAPRKKACPKSTTDDEDDEDDDHESMKCHYKD